MFINHRYENLFKLMSKIILYMYKILFYSIQWYTTASYVMGQKSHYLQQIYILQSRINNILLFQQHIIKVRSSGMCAMRKCSFSILWVWFQWLQITSEEERVILPDVYVTLITTPSWDLRMVVYLKLMEV